MASRDHAPTTCAATPKSAATDLSVAEQRRYLTPDEADWDDMHHALGRPSGPWVTPYRNYYVCAADGPEAERFGILGRYWQRRGPINRGADAVFSVTPEGQRQLMAWLELRNRDRGLKAWVVMGGGLTARTVVAKSRGAARYDVWLGLDGCGPWVNFRQFLSSGVRVLAA